MMNVNAAIRIFALEKKSKKIKKAFPLLASERWEALPATDYIRFFCFRFFLRNFMSLSFFYLLIEKVFLLVLGF